MENEQIATYLNDHLSGSVVALELLEHLETVHADTSLARLLVALRKEITADRQELELLMSRLKITQSLTRKATAWLAEKTTEIKLQLDDPGNGALRLLETFEILSLGIEGKRGMWLALAAASENAVILRSVDYRRFVKRAEEQRQRVEVMRLEVAKKALSVSP